MVISVEDARELLRREVETSSLNAVAERVGIDRSTLRTFVMPGGVGKPIARVLEPILAYAERRLASARGAAVTGTAATTGGASTTQGAGTVGEPDRAASVPTVSIPLHVLTYWRGRVEEQVHSISGVARSLSALQGMLEQATAGMTEFVDSNVLPGPQTVDDLVAGGAWPQGERVTLPPREESERALAALRAQAEAREAAIRQPAESRPVAPKRRAGTGR